MNLNRLDEILDLTTIMTRKGPEVTTRQVGPVTVTDVWAMPHESVITNDDYEKVDVHFVAVGVNRHAAELHAVELAEILGDYPPIVFGEPNTPLTRGPSYISVGATVGSQDNALRLFALGKVLGFWDIVTPATMGFVGDEADRMAGGGFVMITGFTVPA